MTQRDMPREVLYSEMGDSILLKAFGYSPKLRIIDILLTNPFFDFSKEELTRELGMSKQTLYKNFKDLEELGLVLYSRKIGRAVMYKVNRQHPMMRKLDEMTNEISLQMAEKEMEKQTPKVSA